MDVKSTMELFAGKALSKLQACYAVLMAIKRALEKHERHHNAKASAKARFQACSINADQQDARILHFLAYAKEMGGEEASKYCEQIKAQNAELGQLSLEVLQFTLGGSVLASMNQLLWLMIGAFDTMLAELLLPLDTLLAADHPLIKQAGDPYLSACAAYELIQANLAQLAEGLGVKVSVEEQLSFTMDSLADPGNSKLVTAAEIAKARTAAKQCYLADRGVTDLILTAQKILEDMPDPSSDATTIKLLQQELDRRRPFFTAAEGMFAVATTFIGCFAALGEREVANAIRALVEIK